MTPQTKKIIIWSSVAVILGVGGYFLYTKFAKPKGGNDTPPPPPTPTPTPTPTPSATPSAEVSSDRPTSSEDIRAFQNYVINVKKDTAILGKNGADGDWGTNTQKAWDKYSADYKKLSTPSNVSVPANLNLILQRLGKRASLKGFGKNSFVVVVEWNKGNRKYTFNFFANDVYKIFNEGGYEIFQGKYTNGGRGLSVAKDNYSRTSKVGSVFTTDSFWKTGAKLFTDRK